MTKITADIKARLGALNLEVSLELLPGKMLGITGPSGGGKTSLLRILSGVDSENLEQSLPQKGHQVSMMFQEYALFPNMSALRHLTFAGANVQAAADWLERLDLTDHKDALPADLSGGQRQRVALGMALIHAKQVLFLDEPFSAMDDELKTRMADLVATQIKERDLAGIMVSHDVDLLHTACHQVVKIVDGIGG